VGWPAPIDSLKAAVRAEVLRRITVRVVEGSGTTVGL
jgi:hypothetical protein